MRHYGFTKKYLREQDENTLKDWGKKLTGICLSIQAHSLYWNKDEVKNMIKEIENMEKQELIDYCYDKIDDIMNSDIGSNSTFFWNDDGYENVSEYLCEIISEYDKTSNNEIIDKFFDSHYCEPVFEREIEEYKIQRIHLELLGDDIDLSFATTKEQIIVKWDKYKLSHEKVELSDGEAGDPLFIDNKKGTV
jgi:hypothetical protein